jgi:hypothetical protein
MASNALFAIRKCKNLAVSALVGAGINGFNAK